ADADDDVAARCLTRYGAREALALLMRALTGFDEARVYTIHGFCQRALADHAFESGMPFRTELLADERALLAEVTADFWRREMYQAPAALARLVHAAGMSPASLAAEIAPYVGKPWLDIAAPPAHPSAAAEVEALRATYREARACWHEERDAVLRALAAHPNRSMYRDGLMGPRLAALDEFFAPEEARFEFPEKGSC